MLKPFGFNISLLFLVKLFLVVSAQVVNLADGELKHLGYLGKGEVAMRDLPYVGGPVPHEQGGVSEILLLSFGYFLKGLSHGIVELLVVEISFTNSLSFKLQVLV